MKAKWMTDSRTAGVVAGCAFLASGQHIFEVAHEAGNAEMIAAIHAVGIDGLILIGIRAVQTSRKVWGTVAIAYGAVVSLAFNAVSYGLNDGKMPAVIMAMSMPVALVLAYLVSAGSDNGEDTDKSADNLPVVPPVVPPVVQDKPEIVRVPSVVRPPVVRPTRPVVQADKLPAIADKPAAGTRKPRAAWDKARAAKLIQDTPKSDAEIAQEVAVDSTNAPDPKTIARLRQKLAEAAIAAEQG